MLRKPHEKRSATMSLNGRRGALTVVLAAMIAALVCTPAASASDPSLDWYSSIAFNSAGPGYWTQVDGKGVTAFDGAPDYGGDPLNPATIVANPAGDGYWLVQRNGTVQAYGRASQLDSFPDKEVRVKKLYVSGGITAAAATPDGKGLLGVDTKGRVFTVGTARSQGDVTKYVNNDYPVGIVVTRSGNGYWIVDSSGGLYSLGDAVYHGRVPKTPNYIVGLAATPGGNGYVVADLGGEVFRFGDAPAAPAATDPQRAVPNALRGKAVAGIALDPVGGYAVVDVDGTVYPVPSAPTGADADRCQQRRLPSRVTVTC